MAVLVVIGLEIVHIEHQQRHRLPLALATPPFMLEHRIEAATVGDVGQPVEHGNPLELAVGRLECACALGNARLEPRECVTQACCHRVEAARQLGIFLNPAFALHVSRPVASGDPFRAPVDLGERPCQPPGKDDADESAERCNRHRKPAEHLQVGFERGSEVTLREEDTDLQVESVGIPELPQIEQKTFAADRQDVLAAGCGCRPDPLAGRPDARITILGNREADDVFSVKTKHRFRHRGSDQLAIRLGNEGDAGTADGLRLQVAGNLHQRDIAGRDAEQAPLRIQHRHRQADAETVVGLVLVDGIPAGATAFSCLPEPATDTGIELRPAAHPPAACIAGIDLEGIDRHALVLEGRHQPDFIRFEEAGGADILAVGPTEGDEGEVGQVAHLADEGLLQPHGFCRIEQTGAHGIGVGQRDIGRCGEEAIEVCRNAHADFGPDLALELLHALLARTVSRPADQRCSAEKEDQKGDDEVAAKREAHRD